LLDGDLFERVVDFAGRPQLRVNVGVGVELHDDTELVALLQDLEYYLDLLSCELLF
jgi:hypothetical protein